VLAIVNSDGSVLWVPAVNYLARCPHEDDSTTSCSLKSVKTRWHPVVLIRFIIAVVSF